MRGALSEAISFWIAARSTARNDNINSMIYLGADHRGYKHKEALKSFLDEQGYQVTDMGTDSEKSVDYPLIAQKVADKVAEDLNNRGILLCGSGEGVAIAANKIDGIRAGEAWNADVAYSARNDDNINVLALPADHLASDEVNEITQVFLDTSFSGEERHKRRLEEIKKIEEEN